MKAFQNHLNRNWPVVGCLLLGLAGCARTNPMEDVIVATSDFNMSVWKSDVAGDFTIPEWHEFDDAVQEIKFNIMASGEASGSERIQNAAFDKINGKTVREVLKTGFDLKLKRLAGEREKIAAYFAINKKFRTKEGDEESARQLRNIREEQEHRLETLERQIEEARAVVQRRNI